MSNQTEAVAAARRHREANGATLLGEFAALLALRNVSRDLAAVRANADAIHTMFGRRGTEVDVIELPDAAPLVLGRVDVGAARTIGFYVHYDGQPVEPSDWTFAPFTPTLCTAALGDGGTPRPLPEPGEAIDGEWRLYARSAADDKAPMLAMAAALDAIGAVGIRPTANLVFMFEGEEEIGSPHLPEYMEQNRDRLQADVWLICDGPVHQTRRPQLVFGVRGISELEITVYGPNRALHSGHYGNWAPNPALRLAQLLASMKDDEGNVVVAGFNDSTAPVTAADEAAIAALPDNDGALRSELGLAATDAGGASHALRMLLPSLNVRGLASGGVGSQAANVVPAEATASIDVRLAPGNDPDGMLDLVEAHIRLQGYHIVREDPDAATRTAHAKLARVTRTAGYRGARMPVADPIAQELLRAASTAAGTDVIAMPTLGGSVPLHHFTELLGAPVVITPIANHDNSQHAADENLRIANLWYGVDLMAALMTM